MANSIGGTKLRGCSAGRPNRIPFLAERAPSVTSCYAGSRSWYLTVRPPRGQDRDARRCQSPGRSWIPERSATRLRKADLNVLSKLGNQGLEWRLEPEAFTGDEVGREDDLLDFLVGCPVDIQLARQPST